MKNLVVVKKMNNQRAQYEDNIVGCMNRFGDNSVRKNHYDRIWLDVDIIAQEITLRNLQASVNCLRQLLDEKSLLLRERSNAYCAIVKNRLEARVREETKIKEEETTK